MRLLWLLASVAAASAFHATPTLQPAIAIRVPPSASVALSLRGGGMVDQAAWMQIMTGFFGVYGLGFVFAPQTVIEQNFDTTYDKYHLFIARISGVALLTLLYTFRKMGAVAAFPIALTYATIVALIGPLFAELNLETKPAHKAAWLMAPLIASGLLAL